MACGHTQRNRMRNDNTSESLKVDIITAMCTKATLRWFEHVERRQQYYFGTHTGDVAIRKKKKTNTNAEMDGLFQPKINNILSTHTHVRMYPTKACTCVCVWACVRL